MREFFKKDSIFKRRLIYAKSQTYCQAHLMPDLAPAWREPPLNRSPDWTPDLPAPVIIK